jgi:hypothetical protein
MKTTLVRILFVHVLFSLLNYLSGKEYSCRMVSSGLLHRVALVRTDVSEEHGASFIRVTKIGELGTTQAATSNRRTLWRNTMKEAPGSSETSVLTRATRRNNPEDTILHSQRRENLKSYMYQNIPRQMHVSVISLDSLYVKICGTVSIYRGRAPKRKTIWLLVRRQTIPTAGAGEVSAEFCCYRVLRVERNVTPLLLMSVL